MKKLLVSDGLADVNKAKIQFFAPNEVELFLNDLATNTKTVQGYQVEVEYEDSVGSVRLYKEISKH